MALPLNILAAGPQAKPPLRQRLDAVRDELLSLDERQCARRFDLDPGDRLLKTTISLCPDCLRHVGAAVFARDGRVLMHKTCPEHGHAVALIESDEGYYRLSNKDRWGRRYDATAVFDIPPYAGGGCCGDGGCCGGAGDTSNGDADFTDQSVNKTCTVLVEVTNACNLACPVCYSDARGDRKMPLESFKRYITAMAAARGGLDSVQLTGGEAALHPQFWEMAQFLHDLSDVKRIYLPTNGVLFDREDYARRLLPLKGKLMVLLQFDGRDAAANRALRAADTVPLRQRIVEKLAAVGVCMQLTMTIARGVNDGDVGWVVDQAIRRRHVKLVALQPATYSGRYELPPDPMRRATLSDVVKAVVRQAAARVGEDEFVPIPCSHPNCGWITLFVRRVGLRVNVVRRIDLAGATGRVAYKTVLETDEFRGILGAGGLASRATALLGRKLVRAGDVFAVAVKPFMDRFNYDQDRVSSCCHHLMDTRGNAVSFCEYNARLRDADPWDRLPMLGA